MYLVLLIPILFLLTKQASLEVWAIAISVLGALLFTFEDLGFIASTLFGLVWLGVLLMLVPSVRRKMIILPIFGILKKSIPTMSSTEREALEAGDVSWDGALFSGEPDFSQLLNAPVTQLTQKEVDFIAGPVDTLCRMINDWDITHKYADLTPEVWQFIKDNRFFGMIIPEEYGGLGFSATAQMAVLTRVYGRSITAATTISVPNSLGPSELLLKYGTKSQKDYYLPRLADGREIPCFALTSPTAGSDAASITDKGIVCTKEINGISVLGVTLNWSKRYITLCPVATVIGLAFKLYDPDNLLGKGESIGISCALIPADTKGVTRGRRHFPLNAAFMNGPTQGRDVFIPLDNLIGGKEMAGHGWQMLMECLSAGRSISLPSSASGSVQFAAMVSGAYARIRRQFNRSIADFEGIEEPLARIAGNTYIIDAALTMAASAIDGGARPAVVGAILKYHTTERARQVSLDTIDIHGGKGICLGPSNYLGRGYQGSPIAITVEGANILTRSLIIFGQGAIRCHPYVLRELESIKVGDVLAFEEAFMSHTGYFLSNMAKSLVFTFTGAYGTKVPNSRVKHAYQLILKYSANLGFLADISLMLMGEQLKRKEKISARLGDMLSNLYLVSAVLKRYHEDGEPEADLPLIQWCCQNLFHALDEAILGIIDNFKGRGIRILLRLLLNPLGKAHKSPSDALGRKVALLISTPTETRTRLTHAVFKEVHPNNPAGFVEATFLQCCAVEEYQKRVLQAVKEGKLHTLTFLEQIDEAKTLGLLSEEEALQLQNAENARLQVIAVDDFSHKELQKLDA